MVGDRRRRSFGGLGVEVLAANDERPEVIVEVVDERHTGGDVEPGDGLVADACLLYTSDAADE